MNYKKCFTKVFSIIILSALILSSIGSNVASATSQSQGSGNPYFNTDQPSTGRLGKPSRDGTDPNKPVRAIVQLLDPPLASYRGGRPGLAPTSPKATGEKKLNVETSASQSYLGFLAEQQTAFSDRLSSSLPDAQIESTYQVALNGLTVKTTYGNLATLRGLPGVKSVTPEKQFKPNMDASLPLIGLGTGTVGDPAWTDTGLWAAVGGHEHAGEGIKIADIDTGITPDHPCFDGTGYKYPAGFPKGDKSVTNGKIIAAYAYFRPDDPPFNPPTPIDDPATENGGHGTHTAGTMACNYGVESSLLGTMISGVAPKAQLMIYRVFYHSMSGDDSAFTPELVAAIEQAIKDGADVVNNSWGGLIVDTLNDPEVAAYSAAVDAGMVVVFSAGNSGSGSMTIGSPGNGEKFITVGASTTDRVFAFTLNTGTVDSNGLNVPAVPGDGPAITSPISGPYLYTNGLDGVGDGCNPGYAAGAFTGKIAVIRRGICTFAEKVINATTAGAVAVVVVNNQAGPPSAMGGLIETTIPSVMIPIANAAFFTVTEPNGTLTISADLARITNPAYQDVVAGFSSRGPTPDLRIKPDLTAPGVNILSSVSAFTPGGTPTFDTYQGTSMAAPHVTAAAALLVQKNPSWTPDQIKSALMSTAVEPAALGSNPVNRGAGRLNLSDTNRPDQVLATFDKPSISFGALPKNTSTSVTITATNPTATNVTYDVTVTKKSGADTPTTVATLTVPAHGSASFALDLTVTTFSVTPEIGISSYNEYGKVVLSPQGGGSPILHIPYWVRTLPDLGDAEVLLVNDDDPDFYYTGTPTGCSDYLTNYENVLDNLGVTYKVWDTAEWGYIDFNVARRYSKVLYFSGDCGYSLSFQGNDLANYLAQGGKMIITGQDIGYMDNEVLNTYGASFNPSLYFGASYVQDSLYRGNLPPTPAMKGDDIYSNFMQGQFYDITPSGDGAGNQEYVDEIQPQYYGDVDALPVLTSQPVFTQVADGVVGSRMSSEPTIERVKGESGWTRLGYRTIWLSFGLEGVNNNTSFNNRENLLARAFALLDDTITIITAKPSYTALVNTTVNLSETTTASFTDGLPYPDFGSSYANKILYTCWDFGDGTPHTMGGSSINHVYKKVGTYKVYVEAGDGFGHKAVAGPVIVNVVKPPAAPKTISPKGTISNRSPKFTWTKVSGANQYLLEVYYYFPGKYVVSQIITSPTCTSTSCTFTPAVVLKNGTYKWRVRAGISGVWGKSSTWRAFKVSAH